MNNESGDDLGTADKEKLKKDKERNGGLSRENPAFVAGVRGKDNGKADGDPVIRSCKMCSGQHSILVRRTLYLTLVLCFSSLGSTINRIN